MTDANLPADEPPTSPTADSRDFYDELADHYDLVYADWEAAMERHARAILELTRPVAETRRAPLRVLDVSAGIGTQAVPLAARGLRVTARDLSSAAIDRLAREAESRELSIDAGTADMRALDVAGPFDVVISFDNSVPHLQDDDAIRDAFAEARRVLADDGIYLLSVRDYSAVDRGAATTHRYGERRRGRRVFAVRQEWRWVDADRYRTTMVIEELDRGGRREVIRASSTYYAIRLPRLLDLMRQAGFRPTVAEEVDFFQPVVVGRPES